MPPRPFLATLLLLVVLAPDAHVAAETVESAASEATDCEIGLALGSGGAAGLAHIAMLNVFDELGLRPSRIAGTSIGAVIGALYAAGLDADSIETLFAEFGGSGLDALSRMIDGDNGLGLRDVLNLDLEHGGLIDPEGFIEFLATHTEARDFGDLRIPLEVIATDYWTGETVVLDEGPLFEAVEASMAVPGLFSPVRRGAHMLIDGGTTRPLPLDRLRAGCARVIAVDVSGARPRPGDQAAAEFSDLLFGSFELMQQALIADARFRDPPDLYIKPEIHDVRLLHFNRIESVLAQSAPAAAELRAYLEAHRNEQGPDGANR
ncbi:patatin-like phospholipase family protein [Wenzhouxiangella sp. XN79A]|uniref:patatin-like phospholipase family protein n=1 Tax=Wenzhouxiangella sp. XN79A TaxID=2724193 RepID=UPI00144A633E|nr:patatin-like phospholipase family protein [Wenzhouxiangella sp. XN79A]NKI33669.1 patatin-like phospholipase family protein [Wenzhouxiangella sp. XN79A]